MQIPPASTRSSPSRFPTEPPARSAVLNQLLGDVRVEIEVVAYRPAGYPSTADLGLGVIFDQCSPK